MVTYGSCKPPLNLWGVPFLGVRQEKYTKSDTPHLSVIIFGPKLWDAATKKDTLLTSTRSYMQRRNQQP